MLRISAEQLSLQSSIFNELGRTAALFLQTQPSRPLSKIRDDWDSELLGCDLSSYVGIAFLLLTAADKNGGLFDYSWLSQPNFAPILERVPEASIRLALERQFVTTIEGFKAANGGSQASSSAWRRFEYNPLLGTPVISGIGDSLRIPSPLHLARKASPLGVYYSGVKRWGDAFARDVGYLFEAYVGENLKLISSAEVHPSIVYGRDKRESVDWIVVSGDAVVLVEVKSVRPTEPVRMGTSRAAEELVRMLRKAFLQLQNTADLIKGGASGFEGIPKDRPIFGLVVTIDSFHTVNAPMIRRVLPEIGFPSLLISASELENLVIDEHPIRFLVDHLSDGTKDGWDLSASFLEGKTRRNPVLDAGWASYPWKREE